jgi:hypothetical protein
LGNDIFISHFKYKGNSVIANIERSTPVYFTRYKIVVKNNIRYTSVDYLRSDRSTTKVRGLVSLEFIDSFSELILFHSSNWNNDDSSRIPLVGDCRSSNNLASPCRGNGAGWWKIHDLQRCNWMVGGYICGSDAWLFAAFDRSCFGTTLYLTPHIL